MSKAEEEVLVEQVLDVWRGETYTSLVQALLDTSIESEAEAPSGKKYRMVSQGFMDDATSGNLRVMVTAHHEGFGLGSEKAGFIISPDGVFVDE
jgi:hypothetical protein